MALYRRFAGAFSLTEETQEFHMGLYLLYMAIIDPRIVTEYTYPELVCASISLSKRVIHSDASWPTYMERLTMLKLADFRKACFAIATVYVDVINREEGMEERFEFLVYKFSKVAQHMGVSEFVPVMRRNK